MSRASEQLTADTRKQIEALAERLVTVAGRIKAKNILADVLINTAKGGENAKANAMTQHAAGGGGGRARRRQARENA